MPIFSYPDGLVAVQPGVNLLELRAPGFRMKIGPMLEFGRSVAGKIGPGVRPPRIPTHLLIFHTLTRPSQYIPWGIH